MSCNDDIYLLRSTFISSITWLLLLGKALEEKKQICQHFVIQLDNPTTILQQEEAKVFFTSNSDVKRYEFFFKATTLHA